MNRIIITTILVLFIKLFVTAQACLPEGIVFTTQAQIDNFQSDYPGCTVIEGDVVIGGADIINLNGLVVLSKIGGLFFVINTPMLVSLSGLDNVTIIENGISINNTILTTLEGLHNLESFSGNLTIDSNPNLISIQSLINIDSISGYLALYHNYALTNLSGLDNINYIGEYLFMHYNTNLISLEGLDELKSINGSFVIIEHPMLSSLSHLKNLRQLNGNLVIKSNSLLSSLYGLDSLEIEEVTGLIINSNPLLEICNVISICELIISLGDLVSITDNAPGCNTREEIIAACLVEVNEVHAEFDFSIYPNPSENEIFIEIGDETTINEINIYNQLGQKVWFINQFENRIDVSNLNSGIYIIELVNNQSKIKEKLIIR